MRKRDVSEISGFHGCECIHCVLLGCDAVYLVSSVTIQKSKSTNVFETVVILCGGKDEIDSSVTLTSVCLGSVPVSIS
jgi:hypothetical protein